MVEKYKTGTRIGLPLWSKYETEKRIIYGKIIGRRIGKFRGRKIIEYKIKFDDGTLGWYHSPEFRKTK